LLIDQASFFKNVGSCHWTITINDYTFITVVLVN